MFVLLAAGIIWHDSTSLYQRMIDDRIDKLQATTDTVRGQIEPFYRSAASGVLSQAQLLEQVRGVIHNARYDNGSGYFTLMEPRGLIVAISSGPAREGIISPAADSKGKLLVDIIADGFRGSPRESTIVSYDFPKPGEKKPLQKLAYVARVQGTPLILMSGAWVDDIDALFRATVIRSISIGGFLLLLVVAIAWLINRDISGSLNALKRAMQQIAHGELTRAIPGTERRDEVGEMAVVVEVFKENAARIGQLQERQRQTEQEASTEKRRGVLKLADDFESQVGEVATRVASSAGVMNKTAASMNDSVDQTVANAVAVSESFRQSAGNVQSVAAAVEELSSSIQEISRQVTRSSAKAEEAVSASGRSQDLVQELSSAASQVGAVTNLISEIAGRTNLLALNATIEAARAGESGKGFAVVASEVKNLASQTAKATEEISQHILRIQNVTEQTVKAIAEIGGMIHAMSSTSAAIAAAVEEQGAVTTDIGRSVAEVAHAATQMTTTLDQVTHAVSEDGAAAGTVLGASEDLRQEAQTLRERVDHLLGELRAA